MSSPQRPEPDPHADLSGNWSAVPDQRWGSVTDSPIPAAPPPEYPAPHATLISPPSPSLTSLAARAGARPSVERALADLDAPALDAARAVLATGSQDPAALAAALGGDEGGVDEEAVAAGLEQLTRLCLLTAAGPVTGLVEALRPAPAAASATGAAGAEIGRAHV